MFLDFTSGHWLSLEGGLYPATHTLSFFAKLFAAWAAMRFRTPRVDIEDGDIRAS